MISVLISIFMAGLFYWETYRFAEKINRQTYQDMNSLISLPFSIEQLITHSTLQPKNSHLPKIYFLLFPLISLLFTEQGIIIQIIIFILCYLSLLDYFYYLTDPNYVAKIFLLSLIQLLYFDEFHTIEKIHTLLFTLIFFALFTPISQFLLKKTALGSGDVILLVSLSPLFYLTQMLQLLLIASLLGLAFASVYFLLKKQKLIKLPFIPFISFATVIILMT